MGFDIETMICKRIEPEEQHRYTEEMRRIREKLLVKEVPDEYPRGVSNLLCYGLDFNTSIDRFSFINISSFALVSKAWVEPLADFLGDKKCLEIMAGRGVLSKALSDCGVDIKATDDFSWSWRGKISEDKAVLTRSELWFDVEEADCIESIEKYGADIGYLVCSWPPMENSMCRALLKMREINPECKLIYIGEDDGGCTADDEFFDGFTLLQRTRHQS